MQLLRLGIEESIEGRLRDRNFNSLVSQLLFEYANIDNRVRSAEQTALRQVETQRNEQRKHQSDIGDGWLLSRIAYLCSLGC